jgi:fatty-acyl-CoA synthase
MPVRLPITTPRQLVHHMAAAATVARASMVTPERPDRLVLAMAAMTRWGNTAAGSVAASAVRHPETTAIVDELGRVTYSELWARTNALARGLRAEGVVPRMAVGVLCRNHRVFIEATVAVAKIGADLVFLNTASAGPQLSDVIAGEGIGAVICDREYTTVVGQSANHLTVDEDAVAGLIASCPRSDVPPPRRSGRVVILTSGTTGRPRGAVREPTSSAGMGAAAALLGRVPLRNGDTVVIEAPLFHGWGLTTALIALGLGCTVVLERRFDALQTLALVAHQRAHALVALPVMLQRILALDGETLARYDTTSLRVIASSGSALSPRLAARVMARFGPILYNLYGSTEAAVATIATPADLRSAPGTVGRPVMGTDVRILDAEGRSVPPGVTGRVFVGSRLRFTGYTGGGGKESRGGLLSVGDLGHVDGKGRLFIDGREDDMVVSGGENVFPGEVEELLAAHPGIADVAVVGVPDEEFGQRLKAVVVRRDGASVDEEDVRVHVRDRLARYKVPRDVVFVEELPRTSTGKVVRRLLT